MDSPAGYDPRDGVPSWSLSGRGTAKTREEFDRQQEAYRQYLTASGLGERVGGPDSTTITNAHSYGPGIAKPQPKPVQVRTIAPPPSAAKPQPRTDPAPGITPTSGNIDGMWWLSDAEKAAMRQGQANPPPSQEPPQVLPDAGPNIYPPPQGGTRPEVRQPAALPPSQGARQAQTTMQAGAGPGYDVNAWNALSTAEQAKYQAGGGAPGQVHPPAAMHTPAGATTTITGQETPYRVNPGQSDALQGLLEQFRTMASGGGGVSGDPEIQAALKRSAMDQIENPDVYGTDLMQSAMEQARRELESFYGDRVQGVKENLGARGLAYSDEIAGDEFNTVASEAGRAYQDMIRPLLRERAQSMGSARSAAFGNAMGLEDQGMRRGQTMFGNLGQAVGTQHGIDSDIRYEERGERAYVDDLATQAYNQNFNEMLAGWGMQMDAEGLHADALQRALYQGQAPGAQGMASGGTRGLQDQAAQYGMSEDDFYRTLAEFAAEMTNR